MRKKSIISIIMDELILVPKAHFGNAIKGKIPVLQINPMDETRVSHIRHSQSGDWERERNVMKDYSTAFPKLLVEGFLNLRFGKFANSKSYLSESLLKDFL